MAYLEARSRRNARSLVLPVLLSLMPVSVCLGQASGGPVLPDPGRPSITREQQQKLGLQAAAQVYKEMPVLPDNSPETQYVRQLGERLVATIPQENSWPFEFHVTAQKEINAFALPGGEMFVNIGTITAAADEAQLAGVMSHEMSHVYMQHSAKQMQKSQMTQGLAGLAGAILGAKGGLIGELGQTGVQMGAGMILLKYSRGDEAQADEVGAMILYRAGYNPKALADFFKTLEAQGGAGPQFLSDHPNPGNRDLAIQNEIQPWPPKKYRSDSAAFAKAREHANGVKAYSAEEIAQGAKSGQWDALNKKNGASFKAPPGLTLADTTPGESGSAGGPVALKDVMPSANFVAADLGPLKISRPDNWDVIPPRQRGESLTIAPRAGVVSNGIGYGVSINGVTTKDQNMTIEQVTDEIVRGFQSGGGEMQTVGKASDVRVAGVRGRSVNMQSTSPFPDASGKAQKERDRLVTVPRSDGSVIFLVFVAPESEFDRLNPTFEKMLQSMQ
jgi:beta-barrel assembly-enhancing protease